MRWAKCPTLLEHFFNGLGEAGPGNSAESGNRNWLAGDFAASVGAIADAAERGLDFVKDILLPRQLAERQVVLEVVVCGISTIEWLHVDGRPCGEVEAMAQEAFAHFQQCLVMPLPAPRHSRTW